MHAPVLEIHPHLAAHFKRWALGIGLVGLAAWTGGLVGCASEPVPREQMAVSRAAVDRATGPAAAEAPDDVAAARDKLVRANAALVSKDFAQARRLAEQAEADAALAEAKARSTRSAEALVELRKSLQLLRDELNKS